MILELQKDRYFETLQSKYWNTTKKNNCPVLDDSEGITLQSLGGVFIATLVGLVIAMITLAFEVYQQKKKQKNEIEDADVFNNQASKSKINTLSGYMNHEGKDTEPISFFLTPDFLGHFPKYFYIKIHIIEM